MNIDQIIAAIAALSQVVMANSFPEGRHIAIQANNKIRQLINLLPIEPDGAIEREGNE